MKRFYAILLVTFIALPAIAQDDSDGKKDNRLEKLKALAGDWLADGDEDKGVIVTYRVSSGGSAVVETLFVGQAHEMISIYTVDKGDHLVRLAHEQGLTHYCSLANQPRLKGGAKIQKGVLTFKCTKTVGNAKSHDEMHIHGLDLTFTDDDHIKHDWSSFKDGKEQDKKTSFALIRKKEKKEEK